MNWRSPWSWAVLGTCGIMVAAAAIVPVVPSSGVGREPFSLGQPPAPVESSAAVNRGELVSRAPFEPSRSLPPRRYGDLAEPSQVREQASDVPTLEVVGSIRADPASVLVRGLPGHARSVALRVGDTVGGVRLTRVTNDLAILQVRDTVLRIPLQAAGEGR